MEVLVIGGLVGAALYMRNMDDFKHEIQAELADQRIETDLALGVYPIPAGLNIGRTFQQYHAGSGDSMTDVRRARALFTQDLSQAHDEANKVTALARPYLTSTRELNSLPLATYLAPFPGLEHSRSTLYMGGISKHKGTKYGKIYRGDRVFVHGS